MARASDSLIKLIDAPSWRDTIRASALNGLAALGDKRAEPEREAGAPEASFLREFGCGTRIWRVISRAGRPCHSQAMTDNCAEKLPICVTGEKNQLELRRIVLL